MIFSAWGNGDSQTLLQLLLCSKLTQCQENADLTMYGFMMKSRRGGLRKIRTRDVQKVHCAVKRSTFRTREAALSSDAKDAKHQCAAAAACSTAPDHWLFHSCD